MKTHFYIGAAVVAVLSASAVNAQVLGGGVGGGLGGTLSGGMHDVGIMTQGNGHGAFGSSFDPGSLHAAPSDFAGRVGSRARNAGDKARGHAESAAGKVKDKSATATTAAHDTMDAARQSEIPRLDSASSATGSLTSEAGLAGGNTTSALNGVRQQEGADTPAANQQSLVPTLASPDGQPQTQAPALLNSSDTTAPSGQTSAGKEGPVQPGNSLLGGTMSGNGSTSSAANSSPVVTAQGEGAAGGNAAASRQGVSANATGTGSANASVQR